LLALAIVLVTRKTLGEDIFDAWGWRIPFLVSALLLAISLWIRLKLHESPMFKKMVAEGRGSSAPLSESFLRWSNLKLVLIALFGLLAGQGAVWYTAEFYTQVFLERVIKVEPATVNELIMVIAAIGAPLHMLFAWLSDRIGRKPVMLFGLGLAAICYLPGFQMLAEAANPALTAAAARSPVVVAADPAGCSFQFDPIGKAKFVSSCDIAKGSLASAGVPYRNEAAAGGLANVRISNTSIASPDGTARDAASAAATKRFMTALKAALTQAGYPASAKTSAIDILRTIEILLVFVVAAAALYGPQAAALVELFPTRIRYTALSVPYHIGVGWFGGFLPTIAFAIVVATGNIYAGLWYPAAIAAIGFVVTLFFLPETRGRDIEA
ncbi:MAG: MFS transporter, partial [Rhizomicrobium sp.]